MNNTHSEQHEYLLPNQAQLKSPSLPGRLSSVFSKTSASYKYFWFISILDLFCLEHKSKIPMQEIIATIIANAWYSIHYFKLSFGRTDSLYQAVIDLQKITSLPIDSSINSSKSNRIPSLSKFLPSFVQLHHSALIYTYNVDPNNRLIEDYQSIGASVNELVHMEYESFYDLYNKTIAPLSQIAINTGFMKWEY